MARKREDKELAQYRDLLETPTEFKDGFGWSTVIGIIFCGLVMMPGAIYLGLMTGGSMGSAATWVTVILFNEVARRAMKTMSKQNLVVLLHAASVIMAGQVLFPGGPLGHVVYRAYLVTSDAIRDSGMRDYFPSWWVPAPDSPAITERLLFHRDWLIPLGLVAFTMVIGFVSKYTLGYFFFRLTSDVERLPFPLAPIQAQGAMALAEAEPPADAAGGAKADKGREAFLRGRRGEKKRSERWRLFSLGTTIGIAFGFVQVGIPAITGLMFDKPFFLLPQPFVDTTPLTEVILPATPTGMTVDLGIVLIGFVLPFWAVVGTFAAIVFTLVVNPILHNVGMLTSWQPGMDTVNTTFANSIDFYLSFGIGAALGVAIVSIYQTVRDVRARLRDMRDARGAGREEDERGNLWRTPKLGRGDYPMWLALIGYVVSSALLVGLCYLLLRNTGTNRFGLLSFLLIFVCFYNPFISYVNARLLGIAGQNVDIPFVKEVAFIASGAQGIDVWLAPIPLDNQGYQAQAFRVNELTGVSFRSLIKTDLVALPALFLMSLLFWAFIWHASPVPSDAFPAAQINWDLQAKQNALLFSSTFAVEGGEVNIADSQFMQAIHLPVIGAGVGVTVGLFILMGALGLPVLFVYGLIRGFGQFPHYMLLEIVGAMLGRFYFQKRLGAQRFLRLAPTLLAGYFTGVGLVGMTTIAMKLIGAAVSPSPF
jgi:hypothetical protein